MKIKNHFLLLSAMLAVIPVVFFIAQALHEYLLKPQNIFFEQLNLLNTVNEMDISIEDKKLLVKTIKNRPLDVEDAFILNDGTILVSNIPELLGKKRIKAEEFVRQITNPRAGMLFQITTLPSGSEKPSILHIVKFTDSSSYKKQLRLNVSSTMRYLILTFFLLVELTCIIFAIIIMNKISKSLTFLRNETKKMAAGNLETKIELPPGTKSINEITSLTENLEILRADLKDYQNRRTRLIMGISHDLRTPLAIINGYTEALRDGMMHNQCEAENALNIIKRNTASLNNMIDTLINYVKLNSTEWRRTMIEVDLAEVLVEQEKICLETGNIFQRNIVISTQVPKGIIVKMDTKLFERAISNLLSNAIRYSKDGDTIFLKSYIQEDDVKISITDTGIGIKKEDLDFVFDLFYKSNPSRTSAGMGIGLAVVRNIIETHGWRIDVQSELGKGSVFTITIPVNEVEKKSGTTFIN